MDFALACPLAWRRDAPAHGLLVFPLWQDGETGPLWLEHHPLTGESRWCTAHGHSPEFWWDHPSEGFRRLLVLLKAEACGPQPAFADLLFHLDDWFPCAPADNRKRLAFFDKVLGKRAPPPVFVGQTVQRVWSRELGALALEAALPGLSRRDRQLLTALILKRRGEHCRSEAERVFIVRAQELLGLADVHTPPLVPVRGGTKAARPKPQMPKPKPAPAPPPKPPPLPGNDRWVGVGELARMLKTGKPMVKRILDNGHIPWEEDGPTRVVRLSDAEAYVARSAGG